MTNRVIIADYGSGNLRSVENAMVAALGAEAVAVSRDPDVVRAARHLVVPGVGAFASCVEKLGATGMAAALLEARDRGAAVLGICVGMQMLATRGLEFGEHAGLNIVPGVVARLEPGAPHKLPHIGYCAIRANHPVLNEAARVGEFYFVHSFAIRPDSAADIAATATYGADFVAAVARDNVLGIQFHPEKSAAAGMTLFRAFAAWTPATKRPEEASAT